LSSAHQAGGDENTTLKFFFMKIFHPSKFWYKLTTVLEAPCFFFQAAAGSGVLAHSARAIISISSVCINFGPGVCLAIIS
jgi:hypothetical protein